MWLVYTSLMILFYSISDIVSTKYVKGGIKYASIKLIISSTLFGFIFALTLFLFKVGESGYQLFDVVLKNPGLVLPSTLSVLSNMFFFLAIRFVGLSIGESIANTNELFTFIGFIVLNLINGYFEGVKSILSPFKIILIVLVIISICILPNAERIGKKFDIKDDIEKSKINKKKMVLGIILLLCGSLCDGIESLVSAYFLDADIIGSIDFTLFNYLFCVVLGIIFYVFCLIKEKKPFNPFSKGNRITIINAGLLIVSAILYPFGISDDPIKSNLLIILYPIVPLLLARLILKEKYSWRTRLCISFITALTIIFVMVIN